MKKKIGFVFSILSLLLICVITLQIVNKYDDNYQSIDKGDSLLNGNSNGNSINTLALTNDKFEITYFYGLFAEDIVESDVINIKNAGFTLVPLQSAHMDGNAYRSSMSNAIDLFAKYGINVLVKDYQSQWSLFKYDSTNSACNDPNKVYCVSDADARNRLSDMVSYYNSKSNVVGYDIIDEPTIDLFSRIRLVVDYIKTYGNGRYAYINLFPQYAVDVGLINPSSGFETGYLRKFVNDVNPGILSIDHYFQYFSSGNLNTSKVRYYEDLNSLLNIHKSTGVLPMNISLVTQHGSFKTVTLNDIAFEISTNLAFGMKRISYFTYATPNDPSFTWGNAIVDPSKRPTQHYTNVKEVNSWAYNLGNQLYNKEVSKVYGFNEVSNISEYNNVKTFGEIKCEVDSSNASSTGLITIFNDNSFLLVNTNLQSTNRYTFIDGVNSKLTDMEWFNPATNSWQKITGDVSNSYMKINTAAQAIGLLSGHSILLRKVTSSNPGTGNEELTPSAPVLGTVSTTESSITVNFSPSTNAKSYTCGVSGKTGTVTTLSNGSLQCIITGLSASTKYTVTVTATNVTKSASSTTTATTSASTPVVPSVPTFANETVGQNTITARFNKSTNATSYTCYYKKSSDSTYISISATISGDYVQCSFTSLDAQTNYVYKLRAVNGTQYAESAERTTKTANATPKSPTITNTEKTKTTIALTVSVDSYTQSLVCYYGLSASSTNSVGTVTKNGTGYKCSISNLSPNTTYYIKLVAQNGTNNESTITTSVKTDADSSGDNEELTPSVPVIGTTIVTESSITVTFSPSTNAKSYTCGVSGKTGTITTLSNGNLQCSITGLNSGTQYTVTITATNVTKYSQKTTTVTTEYSEPGTPTFVNETVGQNTITASFNKASNATSYTCYIKKSTDSNYSTTVAGIISGNNVQCMFTNLSADTNYIYKIRAVNGNKYKESVEKSTKTAAVTSDTPAIPAKPTITKTEKSQTTITLIVGVDSNTQSLVCYYGLSSNDTGNVGTVTSNGTNSYKCSISNLNPDTIYYVRLVAKNSANNTNEMITSVATDVDSSGNTGEDQGNNNDDDNHGNNGNDQGNTGGEQESNPNGSTGNQEKNPNTGTSYVKLVLVGGIGAIFITLYVIKVCNLKKIWKI